MITVHFYKNGTGASDKSGKSEMENYLALVAIILKAVCGLASLEGAFRCSKIKQAISTKKNHALFTYSRDGAVCKWPSF